jgi:hypothetical protein
MFGNDNTFATRRRSFGEASFCLAYGKFHHASRDVPAPGGSSSF